MVNTTQSNIRFQDMHAELQRVDQPRWLSNLRQSGLETFESQGIPGRKHEEYKYTNLQELTTLPFVLARPKRSVQASVLDQWVPEDEAARCAALHTTGDSAPKIFVLSAISLLSPAMPPAEFPIIRYFAFSIFAIVSLPYLLVA